MTGVLARIHNPSSRECGCSPECWCQRTTWGRALRWYLPKRHHSPVAPEWKRAREAGGRTGAMDVAASVGSRTRLTEHATVLLVEDVARTAEYYRDALGFDVEFYAMPDHYAYASRDACRLHFARFPGARATPNSEAVPPDMFDVYVYSEDVAALYTELVERGAEAVHGPVEQGYGMLEFRVRDPNGYILAFGQRA